MVSCRMAEELVLSAYFWHIILRNDPVQHDSVVCLIDHDL